MRARCAGTLFKGFQRGHSSMYTLQAVLCQMLGSFGTLVSAKGQHLDGTRLKSLIWLCCIPVMLMTLLMIQFSARAYDCLHGCRNIACTVGCTRSVVRATGRRGDGGWGGGVAVALRLHGAAEV